MHDGGWYSWELRVQDDGRFAVVFYEAIPPDVFTETTTPLTYNDGEWHHVTGILGSGLAELYVDGVLVARDTTNPITSVRSSTLTQVAYVASYFVGEIDGVHVCSRASIRAGIAATALLP